MSLHEDGHKQPMTDYPFHPAANAFPLMEDDRYGELLEDIGRHGLKDGWPGNRCGNILFPHLTPTPLHFGRARAFVRDGCWDGMQYHGSGALYTEITMREAIQRGCKPQDESPPSAQQIQPPQNPTAVEPPVTPSRIAQQCPGCGALLLRHLTACPQCNGTLTGGKPAPPDTGVTTFPSGAVRSSDADGERYDLITPVGLRRLAQTCAEGAERYGAFRWLRGIPASHMISHGLRHLLKYLDGDDSEDHLAHAAWNIFGLMHFEEKMPEMIDIPTRVGKTPT